MLLATAGYTAAGPYLALHGIRTALEQRDVRKLQRHVDFPAVCESLKVQLEEWMARKAGDPARDTLFGRWLLNAASHAAAAGIDTFGTPLGIAAILQGKNLWQGVQASDAGNEPDTRDGNAPAPHMLSDPQTHYESSSRFTAAVRNQAGEPVVLVFTRQGIRWKLTWIDLPL